MAVSTMLSAHREIAGRLGRSVSKRLIRLAEKCWALAAEVPLPQHRILLPLSSDCTSVIAAREIASGKASAAAIWVWILSVKQTLILSSTGFRPVSRHNIYSALKASRSHSIWLPVMAKTSKRQDDVSKLA